MDLRCLQDPNYAGRGVGRHSLSLLRNIPGRDDLRLTGLIDPTLPPLLAEAREAVDDVVTNAYMARRGSSAGPPRFFVQFSPMTHDPLFCGKLVSDAGVIRYAVVYDFIPFREPGRYLPNAADRLRYNLSMKWLSDYHLFAPISKSAEQDMADILDVSLSRSFVTGCAIDPRFENTRPKSRGHVLVIGGGDARKNPEVVIEAHARSGAMQAGAGVPLVLGGNYSADQALAFHELYVRHGGRRKLFQVPGHVSEDQLEAMYRDALAVIMPSRDEGFSIPLVEGMAAGAICLGSDIPAHRELLPHADQRFAPDDAEALTAMLGQLTDDAWRQERLTRQAAVWPRFRTQAVADRFWKPMFEYDDASRPRSVAVNRGRKPRVAILTPLPPDRSGVADYTAATCAELGKLVELHAFSETYPPSPLPGAASVQPLTDLPNLQSFDRVIDVVGNSHFHLRIFEMLRLYGAACIAHDARMTGFYRILLGLDRALDVASKELGRDVPESELHSWLANEGGGKALFLGEIAESATPTIVHSAVTAELFQARYGHAPVYIPFSIYRSIDEAQLTAEAHEAARRRLGFGQGELAIVTFGHVDRSKAPEECISALAIIRGQKIPASLHFAGSVLPDAKAALEAFAASLGVKQHVRFFPDYISETTYQDYLVGADVGVQLRSYGLGGLSGALLDSASAGLPTVSNQSLSRAVDVPAAYNLAIPDSLNPALLAVAIKDLADRRNAPAVSAARRTFLEQRSQAAYARRLCEALDLDIPAIGQPVSVPASEPVL